MSVRLKWSIADSNRYFCCAKLGMIFGFCKVLAGFLANFAELSQNSRGRSDLMPGLQD